MFARFDKVGAGGGYAFAHAGTHVDVIDSRRLSIKKGRTNHTWAERNAHEQTRVSIFFLQMTNNGVFYGPRLQRLA